MVDEEDPNISLLLSKHQSDHMTTMHLSRPNPKKTLLVRNGNNTLVGHGVAITEEQIHDHSNYWKMVVQDYAKKIEDSTRDKDGVYKEQAIRFLSSNQSTVCFENGKKTSPFFNCSVSRGSKKISTRRKRI
jgi:hypothetical protein